MNAVNEWGATALLWSCNTGHIGSMKVLLGTGADPTIANNERFSCLHAAVNGNCSQDSLRALIEHGAHIDARHTDGFNALLSACDTGQSESVRVLLEAEADVNITTLDGNTCLHLAVLGHCTIEILQKIAHHGVDVNAINSNSQTALLLACNAATEGYIKLLLDNGADPNISEGATGYRSLHAAVLGNCSRKSLQEIANKAYVDAQSLNGQTALFLACLHRQQDLVKILLEAAANPNVASDTGETSLHAAVLGSCSKKIIRALSKHGADVNAIDNNNTTALMRACAKDNLDAINVLLNAGADCSTVNSSGESCLHYAVFGNCTEEVFHAIIDQGVDINGANGDKQTPLMTACQLGNVDAINILLKTGADTSSASDIHGATCIHHAVEGDCNKATLEAIIHHGADVNATNNNNVTALMLACQKSNIEAIRVLLNARADCSAGNTGETCLHYGVRNSCKGKMCFIQ